MNNHPLECICSHRVESLQLNFARQAIRFLPPRPDRSFEVSHKGLIVSGEAEASLASVTDVLKSVYGEALCVDLVSRAAVISDAEVMPPIGVLRGTASLAKLLGYAQDLAALTEAKAREVMWLSHYAPLATPPPDGSAA